MFYFCIFFSGTFKLYVLATHCWTCATEKVTQKYFQTHLHSNTDKNTLYYLIYFSKKLEYLQTRGSAFYQYFCCHWLLHEEDLETRLHYAGFRFVSRQEHLFPDCFGTFCISSFPISFLFSVKIISTRLLEKTVNTHTLQWKYKCHAKFELSKNSMLRQHKAQYRNRHYSSKRLWDLHNMQPKTHNGAYSGLENKPQNMSRNIYNFFLVCMLKI